LFSVCWSCTASLFSRDARLPACRSTHAVKEHPTNSLAAAGGRQSNVAHPEPALHVRCLARPVGRTGGAHSCSGCRSCGSHVSGAWRRSAPIAACGGGGPRMLVHSVSVPWPQSVHVTRGVRLVANRYLRSPTPPLERRACAGIQQYIALLLLSCFEFEQRPSSHLTPQCLTAFSSSHADNSLSIVGFNSLGTFAVFPHTNRPYILCVINLACVGWVLAG
jgi:hypothetical protein